MASTSFQSLLLLGLLFLATGLVSGQSNPFFPENGQGFLSAGCTNWYIGDDGVLTATW